jgi:hypothetical protein
MVLHNRSCDYRIWTAEHSNFRERMFHSQYMGDMYEPVYIYRADNRCMLQNGSPLALFSPVPSSSKYMYLNAVLAVVAAENVKHLEMYFEKLP